MRSTTHVPAATVLATLLASATLFPLLTGVWWFVEVGVVVALLAGAAALTRRVTTSVLATSAAHLVTLLLALTWLYARQDAVLGLLPGLASTTSLLETGWAGLRLVQDVAPPAPPDPGIRLLVAAGTGLVFVLAHLVAVGLRQPAVAGLPLLAIYCVPAALAPGGLDWYWFTAAGAGYLLLVASDSGDRVARWGRVVHGRGGESSPLAATGRRVGALALVGAVALPALVPGLTERSYFGTGSGGDGSGSSRIDVVNPIYDLRDDLTASDDSPVLRYETTGTPQPLRIVNVDSFDGTSWEPTLRPIPRDNTAASGMPAPPGLSPVAEVSEESYRITIESLRQTWLPLPYPTTQVEIGEGWLYDDALNVLGDGVSTEPGMTYQADYLEVEPSTQALREAGQPPLEVVERWASVPEDLPAVIAETARQVAGEGPAYDRAVRLQQYFRSGGGFQYSVTAPDAHAPNALVDFLERRSGYCVHYASAMAVMARTLGIPARVAVGFLPGSPQPDGGYEVSLRDAHAWPELYFSGAGWVRFEPTPATRSGSLPAWAAPAPTPQDPAAPQPEPSTAAQEQSAASTSRPGQGEDDESTSLVAALATVPWRAVGAVALVLSLAAAPAVAAVAARRRRWRAAARAADRGAATAEAAWTTMHERVRDLGVDVPSSATPRQVERHLGALLNGVDRTHVEGAASLSRLARAVEQSRYARPDDDARPGEGLREDVRAVVRAIGQDAGRRARWTALLAPTSGGTHLRAAALAAGLRVDEAERRLAARLRRVGQRVSASGRRAAGPSAPRGAA